jgi:GcrA cell cycle regulator
MGWTDERIEELKKLWAEGKSASIVAEEMNKMFGTKLTRNSIIGKIHRLLDAGKMLARSDQKPTKAKEPKERSKHYKKQAEAIAPPPVLAKPAAFAKVHPVSLGRTSLCSPCGRLALARQRWKM